MVNYWLAALAVVSMSVNLYGAVIIRDLKETTVECQSVARRSNALAEEISSGLDTCLEAYTFTKDNMLDCHRRLFNCIGVDTRK